MTVNNAEVKLVLEKLDSVQLELLRLRAMLLPEEEVLEEKKETGSSSKRNSKRPKNKP